MPNILYNHFIIIIVNLLEIDDKLLIKFKISYNLKKPKILINKLLKLSIT